MYYVDTVFYPLSICVSDLENSKILSFLHGAMETSRLKWHNPVGPRSTQSAISGQIDQNASSQP